MSQSTEYTEEKVLNILKTQLHWLPLWAPTSSQINKSDPAVRKTFVELLLPSVFARINKIQKYTAEWSGDVNFWKQSHGNKSLTRDPQQILSPSPGFLALENSATKEA